MYKLTPAVFVIRLADGANIPNDQDNTDYASYLAWIAEGNTPEPADVPDPALAIVAQIAQLETSQMLPRITRESMLLYLESQYTPEQLAQNIGYTRLKAFDGLIVSLRGQL